LAWQTRTAELQRIADPPRLPNAVSRFQQMRSLFSTEPVGRSQIAHDHLGTGRNGHNSFKSLGLI
jgi:hypothetical protein